MSTQDEKLTVRSLNADEQRLALHRVLSENYEIPEKRTRIHNNEELPEVASEIWDLLYRIFRNWMLKKAIRYPGLQLEDAEDLVHDMLSIFFRRGGWQGFNGKNGATVEAWFATVFSNGFRDVYKQWVRQKEDETSLDQQVD